MDNNRELSFWISEELKHHGTFLVDRFKEALEKNRNRDTGTLESSFSASVEQSTGGATLTVSFLTYGRYMEIAGRRRRQRKAWAKKNGEVWAASNRRQKKTAWYNRNRYAGYGRLIRTLTAGMSDAELQRIRGIVEQAKRLMGGRPSA